MKKIGVIGVTGGWSSEALADAVEKKTGFRCLIDMDRICLDLRTGNVTAGECNLMELDGLIIKKISTVYSPDVIDRLEILNYLYYRGLKVFSHPYRIGRIINRLHCTMGLKSAGIPIPETVVTASADEALQTVRQFGKAVFKPLFTSKARGMAIIENHPTAEDRIEAFQKAGNPLMYIQKFVELPGRDLGITFLDGKYLATYARVKAQGAWSSTTAEGGRYEAYDPPAHIIDLARRAQASFGLDFTCVDLAETAQGPVVFEVSAFGGFKGLLQANGIDAASLYTDHVLNAMETSYA